MLPALDELNIIPEHQFGFKRGHGTIEQRHRITHAIEKKIIWTSTPTDVFLSELQLLSKFKSKIQAQVQPSYKSEITLTHIYMC